MRFYDSFRSIVGYEYASTNEEALEEYSQDQSPFPAIQPEMILKPRTTEEVSEILKLCNKARVSVMPFGSGYSFSGLSNRKGSAMIVLDMKRMSRLLEINQENLYVRAECGAIVGNLADKILKKGYYINTVTVPYYHDTLGGMISGVIGGGIPQFSSSVGFNNRHILGLKVVLPTGTIVETSGFGTNVHGGTAHMRETNAPDITGLFVGDGGIFGVKTEATLAMYSLPPYYDFSSWLFKSFKKAWKALYALMSSKEILFDSLTFHSPSIPRSYTKGTETHGEACGLAYYVHAFSNKEVERKKSIAERMFRENGGHAGTRDLNRFAENVRSGGSFRKPTHFVGSNVKRAACTYFTPKSSFLQTFLKVESYVQQMVTKANRMGLDLASGYIVHPMLNNTVYGNHVVYYHDDPSKSAVYKILKEANLIAIREGAYPETHGGYAADSMGGAWTTEFRSLIGAVKSTLDPKGTVNPKLWFSV